MNRYNNKGMSSHSGGPGVSYVVRRGSPHERRYDDSFNLSRTNVFIRGLNPNTTDQDLFNLCEKFGPIVSYRSITDRETNECKGYGFVNFELPEDASKAVLVLHDMGYQARMSKENQARNNGGIGGGGDRPFNPRYQQLGGYRRMEGGNPRYSNGGSDQRPLSKTNLYLRGLDVTTSDRDLHELCTRYGNIISAKAIIDRKTNECKGYGFVNFDSELSAEQAVSDLSARGYQVSMSRESRSNNEMTRPEILADGPMLWN